ncbi:MAG: translocation/assembly module TamB domain-containing protein [Bacteroidota bacterium]
MLRRILKVFACIIGIVFFLFAVIWMIIQIPSVQTKLVQQATKSLSETLNTDVGIGGVDIDFFKTVVLKDIYIESQQQDTLIFAERIGVNVGLARIFNNHIHVKHVDLQGVKTNLYRAEADSLFNYQFLIDAFASTEPVDTTASTTVWTFGIDQVDVRDTYFRMLDEYAYNDTEVYLDHLEFHIDDLDMEKQRLDINLVRLRDSDIRYSFLEKPDDPIVELPDIQNDSSEAAPLVFPDFGWELYLNKLSLVDNHVVYEDRNRQRIEKAVDFNHLNLTDLNIELRNWQLLSDRIEGKVKTIAFEDHSGFVLDDSGLNWRVTPEAATISNFSLSTPKSKFKAKASANYPDFAALVDDLEAILLDFEVQKMALAFEDLRYFAPSVTEINQLNTSLDKTINFSGKASGTLADLRAIEVDFSVDNDIVLRAVGSASDLMDTDQLKYNIRLRKLTTSYQRLKRLTRDVPLPKGLKDLGRIDLTGQFIGGLNQVSGKEVRLETQAYTRFIGDFLADHLTDSQPIAFNLDIRELRTQASEASGLVEGGLPPEVKRMGKIYFSGNISGDEYNIDANGELKTDVGSVTTDAKVAFNSDYTNASYNGQVQLNEFDLGYVLQDTTIGTVSFELAGTGNGLAADSIRAELNGQITSFDYLGYNYQNLQVDGIINRKEFIGEASLQDPNLTFTFQGDVNLNDSLPDLNFTASIDTVNFANLNFEGIPYAFSGDIDSDFQGSNADNISGTARIENIYLSNDSAFMQTDSIVLLASEIDTGRSIVVQSEFLNFSLRGDYNIAELPILVNNYVNDYFPVDGFISPVDQTDSLAIEPGQPRATLPDQNFTAIFELAEPLPLINIFYTGIEQLDTATAKFVLNTKAKNLSFSTDIPFISVMNNNLSNIKLRTQGTPSLLNSRLSVEDINYGMDRPISIATVGFDLGNDSLFMSVEALESVGDSSLTKLALSGQANQPNERYIVTFDEQLTLNNEAWQISPENEIVYLDNLLNISNLNFKKEDQVLALSTEDRTQDQDVAPIKLGFQNFELSEIFNFINMEEANYAGEINGGVTVRDYSGNLNYLADLSINNILLEDQAVGDLNVKASQDGQNPVINIDAALDGQMGAFTAKGNYEIPSEAFDIAAEMDDFKIKLIDPFMQDLIRESRGELNGTFDITGTPTAPQIAGRLGMDSVSTVLGIAGVRYTVARDEITFDNSIMKFGTLDLEDANGNKAQLQGAMDISDLEAIKMDLNFSTSRFQVLNTTSKDEELYYGKLMVSADVDIQGTTLEPVIDMSASTLSGTQLIVQPLTVEAAVASQRDFIIYADPEEYLLEDSTRNLNDVYQVNTSGVDLTMKLEVTPSAELQIVIDPATGDKLVCRGAAEMVIDMAPNGIVDILGNYRITDGRYSMNYQGLVKKEFELKPDSRLDFVGDPLDTRFDISAIYTAETPTFELIRNRITDENSSEALAAKRRTDVDVVLNMRGALDEPEISFDIQVPQGGSGVTSITRQELQRLRDNPSELNKQVFSLLLLNSFISQQSGGGGIADAGRSVALSSVSSLLTNQLNRLADNYVKGVDINIGIDSYQSDYDLGDAGNTVTELNLGVSKQFFDDRLSVQVGGNVNVNSQSALVVEGANFSSIAGDFVLEYKLTPAGNYRLRVFRRENFDVLNQDNSPQTGVGLTFTKSFGEVKGEEEQNFESKER